MIRPGDQEARLSLRVKQTQALLSRNGESQVFTVHAEHSRINVTVGGNALFSVRPSAEVTSGSWAFYGKLVLQWINANVVYGSGYQSRAELFSSNGSLLLRSVNMSDSGEYIVNMLTKSGSSASATITLRVLAPLTDASCNLGLGAIAGIILGLLGVGLIGGISGWLIARKTGTLATNTANSLQTYENLPRNEQVGLNSCVMRNGYDDELLVKEQPPSDCRGAHTVSAIQRATVTPPKAQLPPVISADGRTEMNACSLTATWIRLCSTWMSVNTSENGEYRVTMVPKCGSQASATITLRVLETRKRGSVSECNRHRRSSLEMAGQPLTALALYLFIFAGESQTFTIHVDHSQIHVADGGSAFFSVRPSAEVTGGSWTFVKKTVARWISETVSYGNGYNSRAELFTSNWSLLLRSVKMSDTGRYQVNMLRKSGSKASATITLQVLEPVSKPKITSNATSLREKNDTVKLTCFATGTAVSYLWLEDNIIIAGGRFELGADNSTLTISGVLRTDRGFICRAYNLISRRTSDPFNLNVHYGPDRPNITTHPDSPPYLAGSTVTLTCFADSSPAANIDWHLNGAYLQTGQQLILENISVRKSGNYTCQAFNNLTEKYNASTLGIIVIEPVSNVIATLNNVRPVENEDTVVLICNTQGTVLRRTWLKNDLPIHENDRIFTSSDKTKLTITRVKRTDTGTYNCTASNDYNSGSALIYVQVNYGPENITILPQGPVVADIGSPLTLTCSAHSVPSGEYKWFNGTNHLQTGQQYTMEAVRSVDSGNYTCEVYNYVTMKRSNLIVEVTARSVSHGVKAGDVIGVLAGVVLVSGLAAWFIKKNASRIHILTSFCLHSFKFPGISYMNLNSEANVSLTKGVERSSYAFENIRKNQNRTAQPPDGNSIYIELPLEDRSV
ncbi:neural cell adhesion molecule 2-like [Pristis pectinata]|uniref:neural cell adhesion molecule 2-like n=1 Tax=Pristis pectinata TaxID=685728 RepID=UPI00223D4B43|nr:neural cell adhesion molecule 2-like [Pristis pectinata]